MSLYSFTQSDKSGERKRSVTGYEPGEVIIGTYAYRVQKKASCALLCHTPMI